MSKIAVLINIMEDISHDQHSHKTTFFQYDRNNQKLGRFEISDDGREIKEFDYRGSYVGKLVRE
jgi:hypothetical protein